MCRILCLLALAVVGCSYERNDCRFISGQRVQVIPSNGQKHIRLKSIADKVPIASQSPVWSILSSGDEVLILHDDALGGEDRAVEVEVIVKNRRSLTDFEQIRGFITRIDLKQLYY